MIIPKLEATGVNMIFNEGSKNELCALKDIHLTFMPHEYVLLIGHNGSGKSTLLNIIDGRLKATSGEVKVDGSVIDNLQPYQRSKFIFRLFQETLAGLIPQATIRENLAFAKKRDGKYSLFSFLWKEVHEPLFSSVIYEFNPLLAKNLNKKIFDLSPGERQSVVLSLLKIQTTMSPQIILADEPTASLDPEMSSKTMRVFTELSQKGWLCLVVTHDQNLIHNHEDRIIRMKRGMIDDDTIQSPRKLG
jgi:ABC-type uncharacterized transport system ATPase component